MLATDFLKTRKGFKMYNKGYLLRVCYAVEQNMKVS